MNANDFEKHFSSYDGISQMLKSCSYDEIISVIAKICGVEPTALESMLVKGYNEKIQYQYLLKDTIKNIVRYDTVYNMLSDASSKKVFFLLIKHRVFPDEAFFKKASELSTKPYLEKDIISFDGNDVLVDCGRTGTIALEFIRQFEKYNKIYVYESEKNKFEKCKKNLSSYENVTIKCKKVNASETVSSICLDNDIAESVSYIKMDLGGSEISALIGAKKHIKNDKPDICICTSNSLNALWEIPLFIKAMTHGYVYHIRHYCDNSDNKTVFYAVSPKKSVIPAKKSC